MHLAGGLELLPLRALVIAIAIAVPIAASTVYLTSTTWSTKLSVWGAYLTICAAAGCLSSAFSSTSTWLDVPRILVGLSAVPAVASWIVISSPVRSIAPLGLILAASSLSGVAVAMGVLDANVREVAEWGAPRGFSSTMIVGATVATGALLFLCGALLCVVVLAGLYRRRAISLQTLPLDTVWLVFSVNHALHFVYGGAVAWFWPGLLVSFAAYRGTLALVFALRGRASPLPAPRLLFLRVFDLGKRSKRLWSVLERTYRLVGSTRMIAGPDLATTNVEPHELLAFLALRLDRRYIADRASLAAAMSQFDERPEPSGHYPVDKLYCRDTMWRETFLALLPRTDAVLMDLRSYDGGAERGVSFELDQLLQHANPKRIVFIVDETTNRPALEARVNAKPRTERGGSRPAFVELRDNDASSIDRLLMAIAAALGSAKASAFSEQVEEARGLV
jgi:hypothetical protein